MLYTDDATSDGTSITNFLNGAERSGDKCTKPIFQLLLKRLKALSASAHQLQDMVTSVGDGQSYVLMDAQENVVFYCHFGPSIVYGNHFRCYDRAFSVLLY